MPPDGRFNTPLQSPFGMEHDFIYPYCHDIYNSKLARMYCTTINNRATTTEQLMEYYS